MKSGSNSEATHDGGRNIEAARIIEECLRLRSSVQSINDKFKGPLDKSTQKNTILPFVFLLGNHSSGKSSFVNYIAGRKIQTAGVAPTDDAFTIITPGPSDVDRDGPAFIQDPDMGFQGLKSFGPQLIHHTHLKVRSNVDIDNFMLVDTPGMIDSPMMRDHFGGTDRKAVMDRGYDFEGVCRWYAERADVILLFFDPDKPGTTGETLQVLTNSLVGLDHKLHIVLNKADQFRKIHDFARAYGSLCWNLSKVIQRKDLPRIYTMCLPPSFHPISSGDQSRGIIDLEATREEVLKEVRNAPKRRVDNEISRLSDNVAVLNMHCSIVSELVGTYRKALWRSRFMGSGSVVATGGALAGAVYLDAPMQLLAGTGAVGLLATASLLWWNQSALGDLCNRLVRPDSIEETFRRKYHREIVDKDEFTLALWSRVKEHMKVGLTNEDITSISPLDSGEASRLKRIIEHDIPGIRREAQPTFYQ
eukprot:GSChrysophyteH1.ASY1.ANO1.847.1 assembled CDS